MKQYHVIKTLKLINYISSKHKRHTQQQLSTLSDRGDVSAYYITWGYTRRKYPQYNLGKVASSISS